MNHEQKDLHAKIAEIEEELEAENKKKSLIITCPIKNFIPIII